MRSVFAWSGDVAGGFCAGLLAFVAVFGALGMTLAGPYSDAVSCWPHYSVFGVINTHCESVAADALWWGTVELARVVVVIPTLALSLYITVATIPGNEQWLDDAVMWTIWSVPVALAIWTGYRHWRMNHPIVGGTLLALFLGQVMLGAIRI